MDPREHAGNGDRHAGLNGAATRTAVELLGLYREFPAWAVWLPAGGTWVALRPASSRQPAPELPMIWVTASSAMELASRMRAAQQQLGGGWPAKTA
jgi:hypothetical protein